MKNQLKEALSKGKTLIGTFVMTGHPDITEILSIAGYDWLVLDGEHGPYGIETMQKMLQSIRDCNRTVPIIRAPWNDPVYIKRALDIGAYGLLIPLVSSKADAENVVRSVRYPPKGIRGVGPRRASDYFQNLNDYLATADEEIFVMVQIETREAVCNISEILSVDGIDAYFVGPLDLSAAMGHIGEVNHPEVSGAIDKILEAGRKSKKYGGIYSFDVEDAQRRIRQGFQLISLGSDVSLIMGFAQDALQRLRQACLLASP